MHTADASTRSGRAMTLTDREVQLLVLSLRRLRRSTASNIRNAERRHREDLMPMLRREETELSLLLGRMVREARSRRIDLGLLGDKP